ncbi:MAG: DUF1579 family protein [Chthoniobacterales bacterium]
MRKPSAGHRTLEKLAGRWEGAEKLYPSPWDPAGGMANGRMQARVALDGFALITDYEQARGGKVTFAGHGVFTFEPKDEIYTLSWFDCMGSPPEIFTGSCVDNVLTVAHGGSGMHARLTYDFREDGVLAKTMEISQDGEAWNLFFDGRLLRCT